MSHSSDYDSAASDDTAGSLCDFIVDDEQTVTHPDQNDTEDQLSFDVEEYGSSTNAQGLRRSRRRCSTVSRYQDPAYRRLMLDDVEMDGLSTDDEASYVPSEEEEDGTYETETDDEDSEEEEESSQM